MSGRRDQHIQDNAMARIILFFFLLVPFCAAQASPKFRCGEESKCQAMAAYVPPANTTYGAIKDLFQVGSIYDLYGANGVNVSTPSSAKVPVNATVRVPFPCACANGTGVSDGKPLYTTKSGDSLKKIATETFGGLVTDLQIAAVNGIVNASSTVNVGKKLFIPLPCSCDSVDFSAVIHLAHVVREETNLAKISGKYSVFLDSLLSFNDIPDSMTLVRGQVLDVPLYACTAPYISATSPDREISAPNGSYALTAGDCIKCNCYTPGGELDCHVSWDTIGSSGCSYEVCPVGSDGAGYGASTVGKCNVTQCLYAGYSVGSPNSVRIATKTLWYSDCYSSDTWNPWQRTNQQSSLVESRWHLGWSVLLLLLLCIW